MPKKPILRRNLDLSEVSLVTRGANPEASVVLMKMDTGLTSADLDRLVDVFAKAEESPETFAEALDDMLAERETWRAMDGIYDMVSALRETIESIVTSDSTDKAALIGAAVQEFGAAVEGKVPELAAVLKAGTPGSNPSNSKDQTMTKALEDKVGELEAKLAKMADDNTVTQKMATYFAAVSQLSDVEKSHLETLDEAGQDTFLKASTDDRAKIVAKAQASDEVIDGPDGVKVRKSDVGDGVFAMLKKQAEDNAALAEKVEKQARDSEVAVIAKTFDGIDFAKADELAPAIYELRKAKPEPASVVEKALDAAMKQIAENDKLTKTLGSTAKTVGEAVSEIQSLAEEKLAKGEAKSIEVARDDVRKAHPELAKRETEERKASQRAA